MQQFGHRGGAAQAAPARSGRRLYYGCQAEVNPDPSRGAQTAFQPAQSIRRMRLCRTTFYVPAGTPATQNFTSIKSGSLGEPSVRLLTTTPGRFALRSATHRAQSESGVVLPGR